MIHGIYLRNKPKGKWHLKSISASQEVAKTDEVMVLKIALSQGNDKAEVAIQMFESVLWIPEILNEIKEQKLMYN